METFPENILNILLNTHKSLKTLSTVQVTPSLPGGSTSRTMSELPSDISEKMGFYIAKIIAPETTCIFINCCTSDFCTLANDKLVYRLPRLSFQTISGFRKSSLGKVFWRRIYISTGISPLLHKIIYNKKKQKILARYRRKHFKRS